MRYLSSTPWQQATGDSHASVDEPEAPYHTSPKGSVSLKPWAPKHLYLNIPQFATYPIFSKSHSSKDLSPPSSTRYTFSQYSNSCVPTFFLSVLFGTTGHPTVCLLHSMVLSNPPALVWPPITAQSSHDEVPAWLGHGYSALVEPHRCCTRTSMVQCG